MKKVFTELSAPSPLEHFLTGDDLIAKARLFAKSRHAGQFRKQPPHPPYFTHVEEVAHLLEEYGVTDPITLASAYLHDTIEDTDTTGDELEKEFGVDVAIIVEDLTHIFKFKTPYEKVMQISHALTLCERGKVIKIADKIVNARSMPDSWSEEKKYRYVVESLGVVNGCRGINSELGALFDREVENLGYDLRSLPDLSQLDQLLSWWRQIPAPSI